MVMRRLRREVISDGGMDERGWKRIRKKKREWFHFIHYLLMSLTLHKLSFVWSLQCLPYQSASILVSMFTLSFSILCVISIICTMSRSLQYEYINLAMYVCLMSNDSFPFSNPFMSTEYFALSRYIDPDYIRMRLLPYFCSMNYTLIPYFPFRYLPFSETLSVTYIVVDNTIYLIFTLPLST